MPERFRGGCPFGASTSLEMLDSPAPPFQQRQITPSTGGSCVPTLRELIVGLMRLLSLSSLGWQLRERSF
jgi:hypothetical protein